jgi:hypothetical protein
LTPAKDVQENYIDFIAFVEKHDWNKEGMLHYCSDSAGVYFKMRKMRKMLKTQPDSPITLTGGCMAHMSNLVLKDCVCSVSLVVTALAFVTQLAVIIKRSATFSLAVLNELKIQKLVPGKAGTFAFDVPCKTRCVVLIGRCPGITGRPTKSARRTAVRNQT